MNRVTVRRIDAPHQRESFTRFKPLNRELVRRMDAAVGEIFDAAGGAALLKASGDVYLKPNGIDGKPYCHTRPELLESVVRYWNDHGARRVFIMENSTQSNFTRLVFELTGYHEVCRRTGAIPVYLDEEPTETCTFNGRDASSANPNDYDLRTFEMSRTIAEKIIRRRNENLYINLPKLKTHSMAGVTLGVKNQWAFPRQDDRRADHNHNLPRKLADVLAHVRPDFTLIEGMEATIYGHYPVTALADECVLPLRLLIGGANVVATDLVGAAAFGLGLEDVPHLRLAIDRGLSLGVRSLDDIEIDGELPPCPDPQPTDLYPRFPEDVNIVMGGEMCCREGCRNNPLTLLQVLGLDHGGQGGWDLVMGKGHDPELIDGLRGPVLIAGHCAIEEVGPGLIARLGKNRVYTSGHCNDLAATAAAMFHLMKVSPLAFVPLPPHRAVKQLLLARLHGTRANVPSVFSRVIKTV